MDLKELLDRINVLYHKRTTDGLTAEEAAEEKGLRQEYLAAIRGQVKQTLTRVAKADGGAKATSLCNCLDGHCRHH